MALHLGIDIGGTKTALGLADAAGSLVATRRRPTDAEGEPADALARLCEDADALLTGVGARRSDLVAFGVAAPGPLDAAEGRILSPPNLPGWRDLPLVSRLERELGCPGRLENDANAAALAEWRFGAGQGAESFAYLTMSTGIGAGLVVNGQLIRGRTGGAGELGHIAVEPDGRACPCGRRGCLEAYIGGAAWTRRLQAEVPVDSRVLAVAGSREAVGTHALLAAAREGDAWALSEMLRFNTLLARGIASLIYTLDPDRIALGTIATAAGETLCFAPLRRLVADALWDSYRGGPEIVPGALGDRLPYVAGISVALSAAGG